MIVSWYTRRASDVTANEAVAAQLWIGGGSLGRGSFLAHDQLPFVDADGLALHQVLEGQSATNGGGHRTQILPVELGHQFGPLGGQGGSGLEAGLPQSGYPLAHGHGFVNLRVATLGWSWAVPVAYTSAGDSAVGRANCRPCAGSARGDIVGNNRWCGCRGPRAWITSSRWRRSSRSRVRRLLARPRHGIWTVIFGAPGPRVHRSPQQVTIPMEIVDHVSHGGKASHQAGQPSHSHSGAPPPERSPGPHQFPRVRPLATSASSSGSATTGRDERSRRYADNDWRLPVRWRTLVRELRPDLD
jgi:hypothetical protein